MHRTPQWRKPTSITDLAIIAVTVMSFPILLATLVWFLFSPLVAGIPPNAYGTSKFSPCPDFSSWSQDHHGPYSTGRHNLSYQRPTEACRSFKSPEVEATIQKMKGVIKDPDLFRLFENTFPNTLDTAIRWKGVYQGTDEDLTFVITGDIDAMWLRDSANQLISYRSLLKQSSEKNSLASLFRGVINLQGYYLQLAPYCNSFQPPTSANIPLVINTGSTTDAVTPGPDPKFVWECKYELDSLASYLQISSAYYNATQDADFFNKYQWVKTVELIMKTVQDMTQGTYDAEGKVLPLAYTFQRQTNRATETLSNNGLGEPIASGTKLVRSAFRPSDDATIYQLFVPANMMFASYLSEAADIMAKVRGQDELAATMKSFAKNITQGIKDHGTVNHPKYGKIFAYEVDGFGSSNIMDDANIPSLLAAPHLGFMPVNDPVYQATRKFILSDSNPYYMRGPAISAVGGPHVGPGMAWPMASIVRVLTTDDDAEITAMIKQILGTTAGLGLIHESVNTFDANQWTRQW
jgi:meiotically up-regulated gene 157 (Mug157) protein